MHAVAMEQDSSGQSVSVISQMLLAGSRHHAEVDAPYLNGINSIDNKLWQLRAGQRDLDI